MTNSSGPADSGFAGRAWPVFASLQSYSLQFLARDLFAGLTLAAIAIPEQMATARLGGFAPQLGFFAFLAGSLAFAIFGVRRSGLRIRVERNNAHRGATDRLGGPRA